ncbi:hypothetical protein M5K25_024208 [Dendrobium thyrsiflorum]|uniref:STAS domain-containing protein n=1 Tax=Dendrobium thyrsiflorum TaxID=117978 RepID=A0ABD0U1R2_DENTH
MTGKVESAAEENGDIESSYFSVAAAAQEIQKSDEVHKVPLPQNQRTFRDLKHWSGECFFPDDPLHKVKKQKTVTKKMLMVLQYLFPVLIWGSDYSLELFKSDAIAGLTIASLAIPQIKMSCVKDSYIDNSSFVPPLIYLVLGSSRDLAVGSSSIVSVVLGSMLSEEVSPYEQPELYLKLALTSTFFAGALQASLGLLRLGFIVEFLSKPTLAGFTGGAAIITVLQQLKGLTGINHFTTKTGFLPVMLSLFKHISEVGMLEEGLNPPSINKLLFKSSYLMLTIKTGIITGILSLTEGIAVGRTFASLKDYQIDGNKEMMAIGIMNIVGSCSSCFITTGSFSRSAVNYNSGSKTAISNSVMASAVLITMMFLMPLFYYTPDVILAVTIIIAVVGLIDLKVPIKLWKVDKIDFIAYLTAFIGVLFISVPIGLAIAVGISVIKILLPVTRPNIAIMGNVLGTQSYRSLGQYRDAKRVPYLLILSIEFPVYFASAVYLQDRILRWVREEEERALMLKENGIKFVVLDMSAVTAIDISGIDALLEIKKALDNRSLQLVLANPIGEVANKLFISEAWEKFGSNNIYMNVAEAVAAITTLIKSQK